MDLVRWFTTPTSSPEIKRKNFINVQIDAIGVGIASAASPFLPIFLTRLDATSLEVSLLTTMPAVTGFLLSIVLGRFLQGKKNILPWFSASRLMVVGSYALTGLAVIFFRGHHLIMAILIIWACATIPQTILAISFSVVMNAVSGPVGRYELMTRRWSLLGLTTSIVVFIIGQTLDKISFPLSFQIVFIGLSCGGLASYYFSSQLDLPAITPVPPLQGQSLREKAKDYIYLIRKEKPFVSFASKRFVYMTGINLAVPLFPLYFVRTIQASNSWIAIINTAQTAVLVIGYFFWSQQSRKKGSRSVLLWSTAGVAIYPILVASTNQPWLITIYAGITGIFLAGINLVFFDELLKTIPIEYSATFISVAQSLEYMSAMIAPLFASLLADTIGIGAGLIISSAIRFTGFILFFKGQKS